MKPLSNIRSVQDDLRYLQLLARDFPSIAAVTSEIINLEAILHLPKPTEHFLADLHGEDEAFHHVLRNASGNIKRKVKELFGDSKTDEERRQICTLIYYPEQKLDLLQTEGAATPEFYQKTLIDLIKICREVSSKYTRSKVRKALPEEYAYIIEELLHETADLCGDKQKYVDIIVQTIIGTKRAKHFIVELCHLIQRLQVDGLHILGDIFDRGPGAHLILDTLCHRHNFDIVWGNHDINWMGAAAGNACCVANAIRLSLRYANMQTLEEGYAINLMPLARFAMETYRDDDCRLFEPHIDSCRQSLHDEQDIRLMAQMHKAITVIQMKLEGQLYAAHPEWGMQDRGLLAGISPDRRHVAVDGALYALKDTYWPTLDTTSPFALTPEEQIVIDRLKHSFRISQRLRRHIRLLLSNGGMYGIYNGNLLFHASLPMNEDGTEKTVCVGNERFCGRELLDKIDQSVRTAFDEGSDDEERQSAIDYFWYLWAGPDSPLLDKSKMATFERYFIADEKTHREEKGWYFKLRNRPEVCDMILDRFGVKGHHRHIINGHVPVRAAAGENPIKADGRLMVIDGGFARAYHKTTGIAGYTLIYHSRGFQLVQHEPFTSTEEAIHLGTDIRSTTQIVEMTGGRETVANTDIGKKLREQVINLEKLLLAYRKGLIKEKKA
ncbi:MAG: fructose-1,6-bisphosphatase [Prevotellaceae bacterium]|nr:fructose-1,6-bisphosphatase [Prevotellaceae bacterium]